MKIRRSVTGILATSLVCLISAQSLPSQDKTKSAKKDGPATYVGARACKKCHGDIYKDWKKTKMAKSFAVLKPGERAEAKSKAGLDPKKDYTRDKTCLPCHTTGFGKPGGYAIPPLGKDAPAKKLQAAAKSLQGVQCESCHGPGSKTIAYKKKNEEYKWADMVKLGLTAGIEYPDEKTCTKCHNTESPFVGKDYKFDFKKKKDEGTHRHFKMDFSHDCPHKHTPTKKKKKKKSKKK